jgi:hypothetical protein
VDLGHPAPAAGDHTTGRIGPDATDPAAHHPWVSPGASRAADCSPVVLQHARSTREMTAPWHRSCWLLRRRCWAPGAAAGASPLPADQPAAFNDADVGFLQAMIPTIGRPSPWPVGHRPNLAT